MAILHAEHIIKEVLGSDAAYIAIAGTRLFPETALQESAFPFSTYSRLATDAAHDFSGASGLNDVLIDISHYAVSPQTALSMADRGRLVLDGFSGTVTVGVDNVEVQRCFVDDQSMDYTPPIDGSEKGVYRVTQRFEIAYNVGT